MCPTGYFDSKAAADFADTTIIDDDDDVVVDPPEDPPKDPVITCYDQATGEAQEFYG